MKRAPAAASLLAVLAFTACGGRPTPAQVMQDRTSQAISDLEDALNAHDFRRICEVIFSPEGRRRAGGEDCERRLASTSRGVRDPHIELVSARREGDAVVARVRAYAKGEQPAIDVVRLVPGGSRYRIESLSGQ